MIRARGLCKLYGWVHALDELDLDVPEGAIYGFIGENGAGKTTAIRVLATLIAPDDGEAEVAGIDVLRHPADARRVLGYMPDFFGVYDGHGGSQVTNQSPLYIAKVYDFESLIEILCCVGSELLQREDAFGFSGGDREGETDAL